MIKMAKSLRGLSVVLLLSLILTLFGSMAFGGPEPVEDILDQAPSTEDYPDSKAVIMLNKGVVKVDKEGRKTVTLYNRVKVFNKEGRQEFGEVKIPYIAQSGKPELNYIRTITPDGEVIEPDEDAIRDVTPAELQDYPMYSDVKRRVISMPGLTDGAIIDYSYTLTPKRFFLKEDFTSSWLFRTKQPVMKSYFEVSFPSDMEVKWTDFGDGLSPSVTEDEGRKTLTWEKSDIAKIIQEPGMPPITQISERVLVSSVDSWEYYAREFRNLARGRDEPNDAIKKKVEELTKGLESEKEKIHAIYNYVATKIRYVGIELGRGKVQPHKASEVFHNKYGDCKDKATLMISMLDVAGIKAYPVLILSGLNANTDFEQPPPGKGLNHAIVAVETGDGLELMDSTCDVCPYDYLPDTDRNKKALAVVPRDDEVKKIVDTDQFYPNKSKITVTQEVTISEEGSLATKVDISHTGYYSYFLKSLLESYPKVRRKQIYRGVLSQLESGAVLENFDLSNLGDVDKRLQIELSYKKDNYADSLGDSLVFQTPPTLRIPLSRNFDRAVSLTVEERKYPIQLIPSSFVQKAEISVPEGSELVTPEGVNVDTKWASYESSYEIKDGKVEVYREFVKKESSVPIEGYAEFQKLVNKMGEDRNGKFQVK